MLKKSNTLKIYEKGLYFLSLGGIGEIGANCYLYCCDDSWSAEDYDRRRAIRDGWRSDTQGY